HLLLAPCAARVDEHPRRSVHGAVGFRRDVLGSADQGGGAVRGQRDAGAEHVGLGSPAAVRAGARDRTGWNTVVAQLRALLAPATATAHEYPDRALTPGRPDQRRVAAGRQGHRLPESPSGETGPVPAGARLL